MKSPRRSSARDPARARRSLPLAGVLLIPTLFAFTGEGDESAADPRSEGTKKMAQILRDIFEGQDPMANMYVSDLRAEVMKKRLDRAIGTPDELQARTRLAREMINSNDVEGCLEQVEQAKALLKKTGASERVGRKDAAHELDRLRAIAWLRKGEIDNCLARHGCDSCILPIRHGAVHVDKTGSETAIPLLLEMLERDASDLETQWLLNLAHMTLGTWPDGVPEKFRVPASAFESEQQLPRMPDVAKQCGVGWVSLSGGVAVEDYDGDGLMDLALTGIDESDQMQIYRNRGDGTFENRTKAAGVEGLTGGLNLIQGDYDNDEDVDLFVIRGAWFGEDGRIPDSLLRNRGNGVFDDVTIEAGVFSLHPSQTAVFADLDGDGWVDLVVGNESKPDEPIHSCETYLNQRDGTFKNVAVETNSEINLFVKGVTAGDVDNDGRVDLYYSCRGAKEALLKNEPTDQWPFFKFRDITSQAGVPGPRMSFPTMMFDYDNDGWLDIYVATNAGFLGDRCDDIAKLYLGMKVNSELPLLYRNLRNGRFEEVAKKTGAHRSIFNMGLNFGDIDNDGWLDFYCATGSPDLAALLPNKLFRNDEGKRFLDVTSATGTGHLQKGHGVAFADFDNDGDQDLFEHLGGGISGDVYPAALFENPGNSNHWITLRLRGVKANRYGVDARIHVRVATGDVERSIHLVGGYGGSFGTSTLQQEIGLGAADRIVSIEIRWPGSGTVQRFENVAMDRFYKVTEDKPELEPIELPRFKLGGGEKR